MVSALVPVTLLAVWAYRQVSDALIQRAQGRLDVQAKEFAVGIVDRGMGLSELARMVHRAGRDTTPASIRRAWSDTRWAGHVLTQAEEDHLQLGRPLLLWEPSSRDVFHLLERVGGEFRSSEIAIERLTGFGRDEELDPAICVSTTGTGRLLQCSAGVDVARAEAIIRGELDDEVVHSTRAVFLRYEFGAPDLQVTVFRSREEVLGALRALGSLFGLVALLSLLVVFAVGHTQIRRITAPLDDLTEGTERMRAGEVTVVVREGGNDEFTDLARSFNTMSGSLARQLGTLSALDALDRVALESPRREDAMRAAMSPLLREVGIADAVVIVPAAEDGEPSLVMRQGESLREVEIPAAMCPVRSGRSFTTAECGTQLTGLGVPDASSLHWLMVPLRSEARVEGILAIGSRVAWASGEPRERLAHQLGDRLALALAHRRLVDELDAFSLGTLTAFARAVDANSAWTAGHSERVTTTAVALGQYLRLAPHEVDLLRRGGLLHDIGKIGVPAAVLDKPGRLAPEEMQLMQRHPSIGHDILSPIPAMRGVLPIVRHHHERMDGLGYPDGLAGEAIPYLARVLAVADVYDALVSERPYRAGLAPHEALATIRSMAGAHLDAGVVRAFLGCQAERGLRAEGDPEAAPVHQLAGAIA